MAVAKTYVVGDGEALGSANTGKAFAKRFSISAATTGITAADVVKLMEVPANVLIQDVIVNVTTVEDSTCTIDIGDYLIADDTASDLDGYINALDVASTGVTKTSDDLKEASVTLGYATGEFYPTHNRYIGIVVNNTADTVVFDVTVVGINCA